METHTLHIVCPAQTVSLQKVKGYKTDVVLQVSPPAQLAAASARAAAGGRVRGPGGRGHYDGGGRDGAERAHHLQRAPGGPRQLHLQTSQRGARLRQPTRPRR